MKEKVDRNEEMLRLRLEERLKLREIADIFGITRERVRQIVGNTDFIKHNPKPRKMTAHEKTWARLDRKSINECWEYTGSRCGNGYGHVSNGSKDLLAHRLIYEYIKGPIPNGRCVLHKCDNPTCCNPNHLFIGTYLDNARDRDKKGRSGSTGRGKLNPAKVKKIRNLIENGKTQQELADKYEVSTHTIYEVSHRITWKYIE